MADDTGNPDRNMRECLRLLGTLDLNGCHHVQQCASARVALLSTFRRSWWTRWHTAVRAYWRAKFELFRSLRREIAKLRADNERLRLKLLAARGHT